MVNFISNLISNVQIQIIASLKHKREICIYRYMSFETNPGIIISSYNNLFTFFSGKFCALAQADEVVLFEKQTFLVISHATQTPHHDVNIYIYYI